MNVKIENAGSAQLKSLKPFQTLYVGKHVGGHEVVATYQITAGSDDSARPLFYHRVDMLTGEPHEVWYAQELNEEARHALVSHFDADYVRRDAMTLMQEFCTDLHLYGEDHSETMKVRPIFGKTIFHMDTDELDISDEEYMSVQ